MPPFPAGSRRDRRIAMAEGADYLLAAVRKVTKKHVVLVGSAAAVSSFAYFFPMTAAIVATGLCGALAALLYPAMLVKTMEIDIDDVSSFAGKGPGGQVKGFPKHLAAPYFLDGNIAPDGKWSPLCIMDLTWCDYDSAARTMSFDSSKRYNFVWGTDCHDASKKGEVGMAFAKLLATCGMAYDLVWDEKFETAEVLIRTTRFRLGGGTWPLFPTAWYRWWIADVRPDGSAFKRHTLFCGRLNPGKDKYDGVPQHSYDPTRITLGGGRMDAKVHAKLKSVWKGKLMTMAADAN